MKLYYSPGACSLAVHIVLRECGFRFDLEKVDLRAKTFSGGDYRRVNPKGSVPFLEMDDGERLSEAAVIVQFLADQKPEAGLLAPAGTQERYRTQEWLNYIASDLHKTFSNLFSAERMLPNKECSEALKAATRELLGTRFTFLANALAAKNYLMNDYTVADSYLYAILRWSPVQGIDLAQWPKVAEYVERVKARPAVQAAMEAEGLRR